MRDALPLLTIAAVALGIAALATFVAGDRQTLVPPPDAVAESFARALVEERYELAVKYLSRALRTEAGPETLRERYAIVRSTLGPPNGVHAQLDAIGTGEAAARATIESGGGSAVLSLRFVREHGLWSVRELPAPTLALDAPAIH